MHRNLWTDAIHEKNSHHKNVICNVLPCRSISLNFVLIWLHFASYTSRLSVSLSINFNQRIPTITNQLLFVWLQLPSTYYNKHFSTLLQMFWQHFIQFSFWSKFCIIVQKWVFFPRLVITETILCPIGRLTLFVHSFTSSESFLRRRCRWWN